MLHDALFFLAPSSSPFNVSVVNSTANSTGITVNWMYNTSDADGYVVYCNGLAKLVEGGDMMETTLDGLIPGTSYSITVRAYQDILGPLVHHYTISLLLMIMEVKPRLSIHMHTIILPFNQQITYLLVSAYHLGLLLRQLIQQLVMIW